MGVRFWTWDPTPRAASRPRHSPSADGAPRRALLLQGHLTAQRRAQVSTESDPLAGRQRSSHVGEEPSSLPRAEHPQEDGGGRALLPGLYLLAEPLIPVGLDSNPSSQTLGREVRLCKTPPAVPGFPAPAHGHPETPLASDT